MFVYLLLLIGLYIYQRQLIYHPDISVPLKPDFAEPINVVTSDGLSLEGWYFSARDENKPTIVLFHGNAGNLEPRLFKAAQFVNNGYGVLLAEYRGYGGNDGQPSEQGFYKDGRAYIDFATKSLQIPSTKLVLYGESIGSGTATQLAMEYDVAALILEVPFDSLASVAQKHYFYMPVKYLIKDRFMNVDKIGKINAPLLILHGHKDNVIPYSHAQNLYKAAAEPKKIVDFPQGNHTNLYDFGAVQHILDFLTGIKLDNADNR